MLRRHEEELNRLDIDQHEIEVLARLVHAFAKKHLVDLCMRDGIPFRMWESFDDVRAGIEDPSHLPGPVAPETCPGWTWPSYNRS